jgi:hypothetical protein
MFKLGAALLAVLTLLGSASSAFGNQYPSWLSAQNNSNSSGDQVVENQPSSSEQKITFGCEMDKDVPVTFAEVNSSSSQEKKNILYWVPKHFPDVNQARNFCQGVAEKLQLAYSSGELKDGGIYAGKINPSIPEDYVFCLKKTEGNSCNDQDLILFSYQTKCIEARAILYDMGEREIVDTKQRPLCSGMKGDFTTRLIFNWLPF